MCIKKTLSKIDKTSKERQIQHNEIDFKIRVLEHKCPQDKCDKLNPISFKFLMNTLSCVKSYNFDITSQDSSLKPRTHQADADELVETKSDCGVVSTPDDQVAHPFCVFSGALVSQLNSQSE